MEDHETMAFVPAIIGVSQVLTSVGLNKKFVPLVNLGLGIASGVFFTSPNDIKSGIVEGVYIGLSASGLYSGVKNVYEGVTNSQRKEEMV
jgi:hypothetical protein